MRDAKSENLLSDDDMILRLRVFTTETEKQKIADC